MYQDNENIKYIGDFSCFKYNGNGTLFVKNKKLFEGISKNDEYLMEYYTMRMDIKNMKENF